MKQYYEITNETITNVLEVDFENENSIEFAESMGWVLGEKGFYRGDKYIDGKFIKTAKPEPIPAEQRESAYISEKIITWENKQITVDEAVKLYASYFAEQSKKANELQALIMEAKQSIRNQYPDENEVKK